MLLTDTMPFARLSRRLAAVAGLVPPCARLIDIGTDHALLPIELTRLEICRQAIAADVRPGPLAAAQRNIRSAGLSGKIETCLSDGLSNIDLRQEDVVVIAGLGGYEMMDILGSESRNCLAIILQPMKSTPELRQWLCRNGYFISDEDIVNELRRSYTAIRCHYDGKPYELDPLQVQIGPVLLKKKPVGFASYLERQISRIDRQKRGEPQLGRVLDQIHAMSRQNQEGC